MESVNVVWEPYWKCPKCGERAEGDEVLATQVTDFLRLPKAEREAVIAAMQDEVIAQQHGFDPY